MGTISDMSQSLKIMQPVHGEYKRPCKQCSTVRTLEPSVGFLSKPHRHFYRWAYVIILAFFSCSGCRTLSVQKPPDYVCPVHLGGYYPDYNHRKLLPENIRYDKFSHLIYFSIYPESDGTLNTSQINLPRQAILVQNAHLNSVHVSICVGGWGLSSNFNAMAANPASRSSFISNLTQYCIDHNLDGVDLDWEPVSTIDDRNNYTLLIQELKPALTSHNLTLSVAVFALGNEFHSIAMKDIDWIHIMAYDMGTPHSSYFGAISALEHWNKFGFPRAKMILGLPVYGRNSNGDYFSYKYIIEQHAPSTDADQVAGISFNGINTIKEKTKYVLDNSYGGVMVWEITQDSDGKTSLLTAVSDTIYLHMHRK